MNRYFAISLIAMTAAALVVLSVAPSPQPPRNSGELRSGCYVWQRTWDDAVRDAVGNAPTDIHSLCPLCAEISWDAHGRAATAWPKLDYEALRKSGRPISAVLRIDARPADTRADTQICQIAQTLLRGLRTAEIEPTELQVDFDSAKSQLATYRSTLATLRHAIRPLPVRPTVLPSWLSSEEFPPLAAESGSYILQVHATRAPRLNTPETALCDAEDARKWVEEAGRLGIPFRVALPTYTYRAAFSANGRMLGLEAEGPAKLWPPGTQLRYFRPDPTKLAALIHDWIEDRPAALQGLLWYRLPVATDQQNWRASTLSAVMAGRAPHAELRIEQTGGSPTDLCLLNAGEADIALPARIVASCVGEIEAADGIGGYRAEVSGHNVTFIREERLAQTRLSPGTHRPLGWLRADAAIQVQLP